LFDEVMDRIAVRFVRVEPRRTARAFVLGLLSDVERKTCWGLAEAAGHARPDAMQRLLRCALGRRGGPAATGEEDRHADPRALRPVQKLRAQGLSKAVIGRKLGLHRATVRKFAEARSVDDLIAKTEQRPSRR
jgi:DNA invertase Pin-like site-specific DNA recombinase